jgi:hypothetical protein
VTLAGLIVRGRWSSWYSFSLYLLVVAGFSLAFAVYPRAYTQLGWYLQVNALTVLRFAVAMELAIRTFRAFPGARATLRPILLVLLVVTFALLVAVPASTVDYVTFLEEVQPRLLNGTVWIFTAIAGLILWYRLPVAPLHKSILLGYVPYLLYDAVFLKALLQASWQRDLIGYVNQSIYLLLVSHWAWVAWRTDPQTSTTRGGPPPETFEPRSLSAAC